MNAQFEFTFHMLPVLYDVSGAGVQFTKSIACDVVPDFSSSPVRLASAEDLAKFMRERGNAANKANNKHVNDHIFYTDGHYVVKHRQMVLLRNAIAFKTDDVFGFKSGQPFHVRF